MTHFGVSISLRISRFPPFPWVLPALLLLVVGCGKADSQEQARRDQNDLSLDVDTTLADTTYTLVNQDSSTVHVPNDFLGTPVVLGSIYTNCPNVCPKITANMQDIRDQLDEPDSVQFVTVTFDPNRDTPSRLRAYRDTFGISDSSWHFLTGPPSTLDSFLDRLGIRRRVKGSNREFPADTTDDYLFTHSNQITLIDAKGRVRVEYGGSQTPPSLIVRDLEKLHP